MSLGSLNYWMKREQLWLRGWAAEGVWRGLEVWGAEEG